MEERQICMGRETAIQFQNNFTHVVGSTRGQRGNDLTLRKKIDRIWNSFTSSLLPTDDIDSEVDNFGLRNEIKIDCETQGTR